MHVINTPFRRFCKTLIDLQLLSFVLYKPYFYVPSWLITQLSFLLNNSET